MSKSFRITQSITNRSEDSVNSYLKEVSKHKVLKYEDEKELYKKIKEGDTKAKEQLVLANLRFAISVAKQYQGQGMPLADLINEANYGLIKAVDKFDPDRGYKFISYAVWWIRQSIIQALTEQSRTVRLPTNQIQTLIKINKASAKFEQENGRQPSNEELSAILDIPSEKISLILDSSNKCLSIDLQFSDDEDSGTLLDIIPNGDKSIDSDLIEDSLSIDVKNILNKLPDRKQDIIRMFFGIGMQQLNTKEIAERFGITTERVRQLKDETLKFLGENYNSNLERI